ncbi:hypothetical protein FHL15_004472 [Xylaria flabelliformis]|uniref:Cupin 2 conserved barrel domain-containing protein n=1 Tax=Xylaria flabelliformis TaxID=2512241 RepID=A0A553I3C7_9PEZI|nr:hypothetical protein FHL15_004472 [Xylaria flabelliformis]
MTPNVTPFEDLKVLKHQIPASEVKLLLSDIGIVKPQWRATMYAMSHFYNTLHGVLTVTNGKAAICFGHEENPGKVTYTIEKGDLVIILAGVAHRLQMIPGEDFEIVGPYPKGCS